MYRAPGRSHGDDGRRAGSGAVGALPSDGTDHRLLSVLLPNGRQVVVCMSPLRSLRDALHTMLSRCRLNVDFLSVIELESRRPLSWHTSVHSLVVDAIALEFKEGYVPLATDRPADGPAAADEAATSSRRSGSATVMRKRTNIAMELLSSEELYVDMLSVLVESFLVPMARGRVLNEIDLTTVFGNVRDVLEVNAAFLIQFQAQMSSWDPMRTQIGPLFLSLNPHVDHYVTYCSNHSKSVQTLQKCQQNNESFATFLVDVQQRLKCSRSNDISTYNSLDSLLLMPVQRIPRYRLLLGELLHLTPPEHPDYELLTRAVEWVNNTVEDLNESIRRIENAIQVAAINKSFPSDTIPPYHPALSTDIKWSIHRRSRRFVKEGFVRMMQETGAMRERYLFLMSDCLLIAKTRWSPLDKSTTYRLKECVSNHLAWVGPALMGSADDAVSFVVHWSGTSAPPSPIKFAVASVTLRDQWVAALSENIREERSRLLPQEPMTIAVAFPDAASIVSAATRSGSGNTMTTVDVTVHDTAEDVRALILSRWDIRLQSAPSYAMYELSSRLPDGMRRLADAEFVLDGTPREPTVSFSAGLPNKLRRFVLRRHGPAPPELRGPGSSSSLSSSLSPSSSALAITSAARMTAAQAHGGDASGASMTVTTNGAQDEMAPRKTSGTLRKMFTRYKSSHRWSASHEQAVMEATGAMKKRSTSVSAGSLPREHAHSLVLPSPPRAISSNFGMSLSQGDLAAAASSTAASSPINGPAPDSNTGSTASLESRILAAAQLQSGSPAGSILANGSASSLGALRSSVRLTASHECIPEDTRGTFNESDAAAAAASVEGGKGASHTAGSTLTRSRSLSDDQAASALAHGRSTDDQESLTSPPPTHSSGFFGQPLSALLGDAGELPQPLEEMLQVLLARGPSTPGVFRRPGDDQLLKGLVLALDKGLWVDLSDVPVLVLGSLLKRFLRRLPDCVLGSANYEKWVMAATDDMAGSARVKRLRQLLKRIPNESRTLLCRVIGIMSAIAAAVQLNQMSSRSLSVCLGPCMLWPSVDHGGSHVGLALQKDAPMLFEFILAHSPALFGAEVVAASGVDSFLSLALPVSRFAPVLIPDTARRQASLASTSLVRCPRSLPAAAFPTLATLPAEQGAAASSEAHEDGGAPMSFLGECPPAGAPSSGLSSHTRRRTTGGGIELSHDMVGNEEITTTTTSTTTTTNPMQLTINTNAMSPTSRLSRGTAHPTQTMACGRPSPSLSPRRRVLPPDPGIQVYDQDELTTDVDAVRRQLVAHRLDDQLVGHRISDSKDLIESVL